MSEVTVSDLDAARAGSYIRRMHDPATMTTAPLEGTTITVNDEFRTALRELQDSPLPGNIVVIHGGAIFLTDVEQEAVRWFNPLHPSDFGGDLVTWRQHLRDLIAL